MRLKNVLTAVALLLGIILVLSIVVNFDEIKSYTGSEDKIDRPSPPQRKNNSDLPVTGGEEVLQITPEPNATITYEEETEKITFGFRVNPEKVYSKYGVEKFTLGIALTTDKEDRIMVIDKKTLNRQEETIDVTFEDAISIGEIKSSLDTSEPLILRTAIYTGLEPRNFLAFYPTKIHLKEKSN